MPIVAKLAHDSVPADAMVAAVRLREGLSTLFDGEIEFVCDDPNLELEPLLWTEVGIAFEHSPSNASRMFHGIIEEADYLEVRELLFAYRLRFRPRLNGLAYRVRSRIFQDQTAVQIVRSVIEGAGIPADQINASGLHEKYLPREYCTQWRESELAFVLRLLEEEGIFYWFEHSESGHVLMLADNASVHAPIEGNAALPLSFWTGKGVERERVMDLTLTSRLLHGACAARDWDWRKPQAPAEASQTNGLAGLECYQFPGGFTEPSVGKRRVQDWLRAQQARRFELRGKTSSVRFAPGRKFQLIEARPETLEREYLLVEVRHQYASAAFVAGTTGEAEYCAEFTAIPSELPFKPLRLTPKPQIHGKESAVITGPPGEEIHVDSFGRVKVHFYWDREGAVDDHASCWMRVQQQNLGGSMILPRVGWEVDVGFLFGDPDRPVVLERLYNAETMPPYRLPDNLMQSSLQTSSTPGGGGTNEIRMNDSSGSMEFSIHAQKDLSIQIGNDLVEEIAVDSEVQVAADCATKVDATEELTIGGNQSHSITGGATHETVGAKSVNVGAVDEWGVSAMHAARVKGARTEKIGGLHNVLAEKVTETFNAGHTRTVGGALAFSSAGPIVEAVAGRKTETVGGIKLEKVRKSKAEDIKTGKVLTAGVVSLQTGKDLTVAAQGAIAITTGGPVAIKCGSDFNLSGSSVTITVASAKLQAGGELKMTPASVKIKADEVGGDGQQVKLEGNIKYREGG
jgi:type VI secretion system secreted protein VgrG